MDSPDKADFEVANLVPLSVDRERVGQKGYPNTEGTFIRV